MTVAIVLSTYNGEKYITEQLDSLLNQTRKADSVHISDDGSTDKTGEIVRSFIEEHHLDNWSFVVNDENKGWKQNFHDLILSATEDIVFPCDQDDIWYPEKVEEMSRIIEENCEIDLLACGYDAKYEDDTRRITKRITKTMKNTFRVQKIELNERFMDVLRPGCSYAIRKSFCDAISDSWDTGIAHDAMIWRCAILKGSAYIYDHNLIAWRRYKTSASHPDSVMQSNGNKYSKMYDRLVRICESHLLYLNCADRYVMESGLISDGIVYRILSEYRNYLESLRNCMISKNTAGYIKTVIKYSKYSPSIKSSLWKLFIFFKAK